MINNIYLQNFKAFPETEIAPSRLNILPENVGIFFFERDPDEHITEIIQPFLDENGRLDKWPKSFFDEGDIQLDELLK